MANKERIDYLLLDICELEKEVAAIRDAEVYPLSFFSRSFELAHKILTDLHNLEADQLEMLSRQMEEHRRKIHNIPTPEVTLQAEILEEPVDRKPEPEITRTVIVHSKSPEPEPEQQIVVDPESEEPESLAVVIDEPEQSVSVEHSKPSSVSLNEILERKILSDFRKAFSLNDRFRFRRELFGGDEQRMNKAIADLNDIHSYEDSIVYLNEELKWNVDDESVADFIKLLEKRFL